MPQGSIGLNALTGHIHNFERWKADLSRSLKSFRLWLRRNDLFSETVDKRLYNLLSVLKNDYVTIAFAGEFSRGKTELINVKNIDSKLISSIFPSNSISSSSIS